jgi:hypothetical protein
VELRGPRKTCPPGELHPNLAIFWPTCLANPDYTKAAFAGAADHVDGAAGLQPMRNSANTRPRSGQMNRVRALLERLAAGIQSRELNRQSKSKPHFATHSHNNYLIFWVVNSYFFTRNPENKVTPSGYTSKQFAVLLWGEGHSNADVAGKTAKEKRRDFQSSRRHGASSDVGSRQRGSSEDARASRQREDLRHAAFPKREAS